MSTQKFDSNFVAQINAAGRRKLAANTQPVVADETDPTRDIRKKQANLCEATMIRVVELEEEAKRLIEIAKKLRAAVVANT